MWHLVWSSVVATVLQGSTFIDDILDNMDVIKGHLNYCCLYITMNRFCLFPSEINTAEHQLLRTVLCQPE